jgi:hypothetical protein
VETASHRLFFCRWLPGEILGLIDAAVTNNLDTRSTKREVEMCGKCRSPTGRARAESEEMMVAQRRQGHWTPDEDRRLLELIKAGKSWVFISANLKRPPNGARLRLALLKRRAVKAETETGPSEPGQKAKGK